MEYSQRVMFWKVKIKMGAHLSEHMRGERLSAEEKSRWAGESKAK
jgi:hypothetical protein